MRMRSALSASSALQTSWLFFGILVLGVMSSGAVRAQGSFDYPVGAGECTRHSITEYRVEVGGDFLDPQYPRGICHSGEDWNRGTGDEDRGDLVCAVADGEVVFADSRPTWSNIVLIKHSLADGSTVWSQYAHLEDIRVSKGPVRRGQVIGTIGKQFPERACVMHGPNQGLGCAHLHFEIRRAELAPDAWPKKKDLVLESYVDPTDIGYDVVPGDGFIAASKKVSNRHSISFDRAVGQHLSIVDALQTGLDLSADFTIEAWVNPATPIPSGHEYVIVSKWGTLPAEKAYVLLYYHDGIQPNIRLTTQENATADDFDEGNIPYTLPTGEWSHVAAVFTSSTATAEYFVNGQSIGVIGGFGSTVNNSDAPFQIGTRGSLQATAFDGLVDEVRVWNITRTGTEILADMEQVYDAPVAGLVGSWRLECDYSDSSGFGNDLTPVNGPLFSSEVPFGQAGPACK